MILPTTITTIDWSELIDREDEYTQKQALGTTNLGMKLL